MKAGPVLVVDDSPSRHNKLKSWLVEKGIEVLEAASCEEALDRLAREQITLVMTETELPTNSGLYLLKEVKAKYPDLEVILITHNASSYNLLQALRHGAFDFIVRPIDTVEVLRNPLERAFNHVRLRRKNTQLLKELEKKNRSLERALKMMKVLNKSVERLAAATDIEEVLKRLITSAMGVVHAKRGYLALFDRSSEELGIKVSQGILAPIRQVFYSQLPPGLTVLMARRSKPTLIPGDLPERLFCLASEVERQNLLANPCLLAVSLRLRDRTAGIVVLSGCPEGHPFSEYELHFLIQLSHHATLALEKTGLIHQLKQGKISPSPPISISCV